MSALWPSIARGGLIGAGFALALLASAWLSAVMYLSWAGLNPHAAEPLTLWRYWQAFGQAPDERLRLLICGAAPLCVVGVMVVLALTTPGRVVYKGARWAKASDLGPKRLRDRQGVLLGWFGADRLCDGGEAHVLITAPTGAGKTRSFLIPNLLNTQKSVVVVDPTGYIWEKAGAYRASLGAAINLRPLDRKGRTDRLNPLDQLSADPEARKLELDSLAAVLFPIDPGHHDPWVPENARVIFAALADWAITDYPPNATLGAVWDRLHAEKDFSAWCRTEADRPGRLSASTRGAFRTYAAFSERQQGAILTDLQTGLKPWANGLIRAATATSDIRLDALKAGGLSLFVGIEPGDLSGHEQVLRLFLELAAIVLMRTGAATKIGGPGATPPKTTGYNSGTHAFVVIDEFATFGRLPKIERLLEAGRGYGVRVIAATQTLAQIEALHGRAGRDALLGHFGLQLFAGSGDPSTADYVAKRLGDRCEISWRISESRDGERLRRSRVRAETIRPLMNADAFARLPAGTAVLVSPGAHPVSAKLKAFDEDHDLSPRAEPPPAAPTHKPTPPRGDAQANTEPAFASSSAHGGRTGAAPRAQGAPKSEGRKRRATSEAADPAQQTRDAAAIAREQKRRRGEEP